MSEHGALRRGACPKMPARPGPRTDEAAARQIVYSMQKYVFFKAVMRQQTERGVNTNKSLNLK